MFEWDCLPTLWFGCMQAMEMTKLKKHCIIHFSMLSQALNFPCESEFWISTWPLAACLNSSFAWLNNKTTFCKTQITGITSGNLRYFSFSSPSSGHDGEAIMLQASTFLLGLLEGKFEYILFALLLLFLPSKVRSSCYVPSHHFQWSATTLWTTRNIEFQYANTQSELGKSRKYGENIMRRRSKRKIQNRYETRLFYWIRVRMQRQLETWEETLNVG